MIDKIDELMENAVKQAVFPGGTLLVASGKSIVYHESFGTISVKSDVAVTAETVFDLASLTKPLVTVPGILQLIRSNKITLNTRVAELFDTFSVAEKNDITISDLLVHTSGLPAHRPYYELLRDIDRGRRIYQLQQMVLNEPIEYLRGEKVIYSDLGFMILGWIIEKISGQKLNNYIYEHVFGPLGIDDLFFPADKQENTRIIYAATEKCPWRMKQLSGEVHDDNAWIAGGIFGHAGLFGTASGVLRLLREYQDIYTGRNHGGVFDAALLKVFLSEYNETGRTFGFDIPSAVGSSSGSFFSKRSVGHLGFTGTSFWMDLEKSIIIILLTNRVNPSRENIKIRDFRPDIHNFIMQLVK